MPPKPATIDDYLKATDDDKRAALQRLRKIIRSALPDAQECISYQLPAFRVNGKVLLGFGAGVNHCALYPWSGRTAATLRADLKGFETSAGNGAIRFQPGKPLSVALVRKIIKTRIAESMSKAESAKKPAAQKQKQKEKEDPEVAEFMQGLKHPLKPALQELRQVLLHASPKISEGIKWNSPSFRTSDWFATINVHGKEALRLIMHTGAKAKTTAKSGLAIKDPSGLLKWLANDRCLIVFTDLKGVKAKKKPLQAIIRQWIAAL